MPTTPEEARHLLSALGAHVVDRVTRARDRGHDMAAVSGETVADTQYAIDRVADDELLHWFAQHWPDVLVVSEGLDEPVLVGSRAAWTVIVDPIDGTRGLMFDKRPAWCLAAAAPPGGGLADVVAAAMTELPTVKQGACDQLSGVRGCGLHAERLHLGSGERAASWCARRRKRISTTVSAACRSSSSPGRRHWPHWNPNCSHGWGASRVRRPIPLERGPGPRTDNRAGPLRGRPAPAGQR